MAITVKHNKVSLIPDSGDNNLVEPSDWNADHVLTGTIPISNGGTGASTANDGFNALAPTQTGNSGKYLTTDGTNTSWAVNPLGTVTSVGLSAPSIFTVTGSPVTTSGTLSLTYSGTALPVANGGTGVTSSSGANSVVLRDANGNITTNCLFEGYVNQAASGTTIVLTASTAQNYQITGSGGQIIRLPDATTLPNGATFTFNNNQSSGAITVQNNSSTTVATINSGGYVTVVLLSNSIAAGSWDRHDSTPSNVSWSTNTLDYPGSITSATWNGNTVSVNRGGTGATTLTGYVKGSGTSALTASATIPTTDLSGTITNAQLANSAITINGTSTSLGGSISVGTVTSVAATAGTGISLSGSPITSSGTLTITNTAPDQTVAITSGTGISVTGTYPNFTVTNTSPSSGGTVTSVAATVPSFLSVTGSPITSSGTLAISYSGTALPILNGGTGQTTANAAFNALAPSQTSNSGKYLTTNGTDTSWATLGNAYSRTSFTATASQTTFTVSYTVGLVQVYVNGVLLNGADYTATNGTSVVLAVACNVGEIVEVLAFSSFSVASTVSSFSGGTTGLTPNTATTGNVTLGGTLAVANGGTGVTTSTGSGNLVLSTSPTLVTPVLGTPTSVNLTNATNVPVNQATGTLPVANGGTGVTTSTGSGSVVLGTSPTIATPTITSLYGQNSNLVTTPYRDSGLVPGELIYRLNTAYVGTATTSAQSLFGVGVTVSGSTVYQFEALYAFSKSATASAHNISLLFGGTATLNNIAYSVVEPSSAMTSFTDLSNSTAVTIFIQTASATVVNSPAATANIYRIYVIKGTVSINAGGTFIPQYQTSVSVGPYTTQIGSYFKLSPMSASGANTSIGTWA